MPLTDPLLPRTYAFKLNPVWYIKGRLLDMLWSDSLDEDRYFGVEINITNRTVLCLPSAGRAPHPVGEFHMRVVQ
jgi:hypothetical protein